MLCHIKLVDFHLDDCVITTNRTRFVTRAADSNLLLLQVIFILSLLISSIFLRCVQLRITKAYCQIYFKENAFKRFIGFYREVLFIA